jgi:hypothetical protein
MRGFERLCEARKIFGILEGRIDEHQAAALLWRHVGVERGPAVDCERLAAGVAAEIARERGRRLGLELAGHQSILWAQERSYQQRRPRIGGEAVAAIEAGDSVQIGSKKRPRLSPDRCGEEPADALFPFAAALRFRTPEIIESGAGMDVDDAEGRRLGAQMHQDANDHDMLDDVGEIAGVEGVAVVHGRKLMARNTLPRKGGYDARAVAPRACLA